MKAYQREMIDVIEGFLDDYTIQELFEILFPAQSIPEIIVDAYDNGMIPNDVMESFLED